MVVPDVLIDIVLPAYHRLAHVLLTLVTASGEGITELKAGALPKSNASVATRVSLAEVQIRLSPAKLWTIATSCELALIAI